MCDNKFYSKPPYWSDVICASLYKISPSYFLHLLKRETSRLWSSESELFTPPLPLDHNATSTIFLLSTHSGGDTPNGVGDRSFWDIPLEFTFRMCWSSGRNKINMFGLQMLNHKKIKKNQKASLWKQEIHWKMKLVAYQQRGQTLSRMQISIPRKDQCHTDRLNCQNSYLS